MGGQDFRRAGLPGRGAGLQEAEIAVEAARQKLASLGAGTGRSTQGLTRYEIRSPIDSVITDKKIQCGRGRSGRRAHLPGRRSVQRLDRAAVLPTKDVNLLKVGDAARSGRSLRGASPKPRLAYVGALVGEQSRNATARLVLPTPGDFGARAFR